MPSPSAGGRIAGRVAVVKGLASAVCIGSGGSVGREGPIVQIGSALGSRIGRFARVPEARLRTLVACGSAAGIAATFNAPIAGVVFALELLLRDFAADAFGVVVLSAVTASVVGRAAFGNTPFLHLPPFALVSPAEYGLYVVLGLLAGLVGVVFTRILYAVEDACDWAWRGPEWARPAVGGLLLGLMLLALPQLYGVGYPVLQAGVEGRNALGFLLVLMLGKMVATSLTIGIGGSGGVFAPSLFIGAMLGSAFGDLAHAVAPHLTGPVGVYALVGMGAVFAGAARAPITAVLIMFELTGEYRIILPLMLAIVVATGVSHRLSRDTIYTLKLRRRGVDLHAHAGDLRLRTTSVDEVMIPVPPALPAGLPLPQAAQALLTGEHPVARNAFGARGWRRRPSVHHGHRSPEVAPVGTAPASAVSPAGLGRGPTPMCLPYARSVPRQSFPVCPVGNRHRRSPWMAIATMGISARTDHATRTVLMMPRPVRLIVGSFRRWIPGPGSWDREVVGAATCSGSGRLPYPGRRAAHQEALHLRRPGATAVGGPRRGRPRRGGGCVAGGQSRAGRDRRPFGGGSRCRGDAAAVPGLGGAGLTRTAAGGRRVGGAGGRPVDRDPAV
jgi:H+/Cl- antiporter ClcA